MAKPDPVVGMRVQWETQTDRADALVLRDRLIPKFGTEDLVVAEVERSPSGDFVLTLSRDKEVIGKRKGDRKYGQFYPERIGWRWLQPKPPS
ncbi:MAG TPA: hypothetical protein VJG67_03190 [Candidatus Paceibacterota bacterium]